MRKVVLLGLLAILLTACGGPQIDDDFLNRIRALEPASFTCCDEPERMIPAPVVALALPLFEVIGPNFTAWVERERDNKDRDARLAGNPEALEAIVSRLRPFDLVFITHDGATIPLPGRFRHSYIYLGTEADLRALGLWTLSEVVPYHDRIRAGLTMVEAVAPRARMTRPAWALDVDAATILRPEMTSAQRRFAIAAALGALGTPYDFSFVVGRPGRLMCTGLIQLAYPNLGLTVRKAYGLPTILPDDVVAQAIRGDRMRVAAYVVGTEAGYEFRSIHSLMADLSAVWGLPR